MGKHVQDGDGPSSPGVSESWHPPGGEAVVANLPGAAGGEIPGRDVVHPPEPKVEKAGPVAASSNGTAGGERDEDDAVRPPEPESEYSELSPADADLRRWVKRKAYAFLRHPPAEHATWRAGKVIAVHGMRVQLIIHGTNGCCPRCHQPVNIHFEPDFEVTDRGCVMEFDLHELREAELHEVAAFIKPYSWCIAGAFACVNGTDETGMVLRVHAVASTSGHAVSRKDWAELLTHSHRNAEVSSTIRSYRLEDLQQATPAMIRQYRVEHREMVAQVGDQEVQVARAATMDMYRATVRVNDTTRAKGEALQRAKQAKPSQVQEDETDLLPSYREKEKNDMQLLAEAMYRMNNANDVLVSRILQNAREHAPGSDAIEVSVLNLLKVAVNPVWACFQVAAYLQQQADFPENLHAQYVAERKKHQERQERMVLDAIQQLTKQHGRSHSRTLWMEGTASAASAASVERETNQDSEKAGKRGASAAVASVPVACRVSREVAGKLLKLATAIAESMAVPDDDNALRCALLQPKLNHIQMIDSSGASPSTSFFKRILEGTRLQRPGTGNVGPLYEAIIAGETDFVDVDWVRDYVETVNSSAFSIEHEFAMHLPVSLWFGMFAHEHVEWFRKRLYRSVVRLKLRPRIVFEVAFHLVVGLCAPGAHFRTPKALYAFDVSLYLVFLMTWTFGIVLPVEDVPGLSHGARMPAFAGRDSLMAQLGQDVDADSAKRYNMALVARLWCWFYIVGGVCRELRQLRRLGSRAYYAEFWNWVELVTPTCAIIGMTLIELGAEDFAEQVIAVSSCLLWMRLLQNFRSSPKIGPLLKVILRMFTEVLRFAVLLGILTISFSVAMHTLLREGGSTDNDEISAQVDGASWPEDYKTLGHTCRTLFLVFLGDISIAFEGARYRVLCYSLLIIYTFIMALLMLNLLITLLMGKYEEAKADLQKEFAFVRASTIFWLQDSTIDYDLPPPFNLLQLTLELMPARNGWDRDRRLIAWFVWIAIFPVFSFCCLMLVVPVVIVIIVPAHLMMHVHRKLIERWYRRHREADHSMHSFYIRGTTIEAHQDPDLDTFRKLHSSGGGSDSNKIVGASISASACADSRDVNANDDDDTSFQVAETSSHIALLLLASVPFGLLHWAWILTCTCMRVAFVYVEILKTNFASLAQHIGWKAISSPLKKQAHQRDREKSSARLRLLANNMCRCIDFLSEKNARTSDEDWTNRLNSGVLDRLVAQAFKSDDQFAEEKGERAVRAATAGVELAKRRRLHAENIYSLWREKQKRRQAAAVLDSDTDAADTGSVDSQQDPSSLTPEEVAEREEAFLQEAFSTFDVDSNGHVSASELKTVMEMIGTHVSHLDVYAMIRDADKTGDGLIDLEEFRRSLTET